MNDLVPRTRHTGDILMGGRSIFDRKLKLINIRAASAWSSKNRTLSRGRSMKTSRTASGSAGKTGRTSWTKSWKAASAAPRLWDEVKDRMHESALPLSGGQIQRLCIARAIANKPQVLLMDEPCSALDPIATMKIEELIHDLKKNFTIVIVTTNMQQAGRCSDRSALLLSGQAHRVRRHQQDIHQSLRETDRGLHQRPFRLRPARRCAVGHPEKLVAVRLRLICLPPILGRA